MFKVATVTTLKRRTWHGCPLNRMGTELGVCIVNERDAIQTLRVPRHAVRRFLLAWDYMHGTDEQCTEQLIEAILTVGLFTEPPVRRGWWRRTPVAVPAPVTLQTVVAPRTAATATPTAPATAVGEVQDERVLCGAGV